MTIGEWINNNTIQIIFILKNNIKLKRYSQSVKSGINDSKVLYNVFQNDITWKFTTIRDNLDCQYLNHNNKSPEAIKMVMHLMVIETLLYPMHKGLKYLEHKFILSSATSFVLSNNRFASIFLWKSDSVNHKNLYQIKNENME